jgi:hypothetical protein
VPDNKSKDARIFSVETNFQKMARRPGGIQREQALMNAETELRRMFMQRNRLSPAKSAPPKPPVPETSEPVAKTVAQAVPKKPLGPTAAKKTLATKSSLRSSGWLSTAWGRRI